MVMCFVPDCRHYSERDRCRFYRFPSKEHDKKRWEHLISRADKTPSRYSLVCSCHFVGGIKANGPTIFMSFSQGGDSPIPTKRRRYRVRSRIISPEEIAIPTSSQDETTLSAHEELNSRSNSPKSLSSISEILETQLYYFDDDISLVSQNNTAAAMKRFDITSPKRSAVNIVSREGQQYVVDNAARASRRRRKLSPPPLKPISPSSYIPVEAGREELLGKNMLPISVGDAGSNKAMANPLVQNDNCATNLQMQFESTIKLEDKEDSEKKFGPKVSPVTNALLEAQLYFLEEDVKRLKTENEYLKSRFCYASICESDELLIMYTGLPNAEVFQLLLSFCTSFEFNYYYYWKVEKIRVEDQLLMTLMKLRRNESHVDLRVRFNCSLGMVGNILLTWLHLLHETLFLGLMKRIPSILKNRACLPSCFSDFSACRMALEMAEIRCTDSKQKFKNNHVTHTHFKSGCILKGLVGVAPSGVVTYCSRLYPLSATVEDIFKDTGLLEVFREGDLLMCDRSFSIGHLLPKGVLLNTPPSVSMPELTSEQVLQSRAIARTRAHVERAICRIKGFAILDLIPPMLRPYATTVWQVCVALTNLQHPLIKEIELFY